jgi:hypothetical protein
MTTVNTLQSNLAEINNQLVEGIDAEMAREQALALLQDYQEDQIRVIDGELALVRTLDNAWIGIKGDLPVFDDGLENGYSIYLNLVSGDHDRTFVTAGLYRSGVWVKQIKPEGVDRNDQPVTKGSIGEMRVAGDGFWGSVDTNTGLKTWVEYGVTGIYLSDIMKQFLDRCRVWFEDANAESAAFNKIRFLLETFNSK